MPLCLLSCHLCHAVSPYTEQVFSDRSRCAPHIHHLTPRERLGQDSPPRARERRHHCIATPLPECRLHSQGTPTPLHRHASSRSSLPEAGLLFTGRDMQCTSTVSPLKELRPIGTLPSSSRALYMPEVLSCQWSGASPRAYRWYHPPEKREFIFGDAALF